MAALFADLHLLEWIYLALFCGGLIYALFLAVFGMGHGHGLDHGGHVDIDHGGGHLDLGHGGHVDLGHGGHVDVGHGDVDTGAGHATDVHVDSGHDTAAHGDSGHAADTHGENQGRELHASPLNPVIIATFFGGFGGFGVLGTRLFCLPDFLSLLVALPAGLALGGGMFAVYARLAATAEADSTITWRDVQGVVAEVITPIPENGLGEILYVAKGSRRSSPARTIDGWAVPRGTRVTVLKMANGVAIVDLRYTD